MKVDLKPITGLHYLPFLLGRSRRDLLDDDSNRRPLIKEIRAKERQATGGRERERDDRPSVEHREQTQLKNIPLVTLVDDAFINDILYT